MDPVLPKFVTLCNPLVDGSVKFNRKLVLVCKIYIFCSIILSIATHSFVVIKYTLKSNGGTISWNYFVYHAIQLLFLICPGDQLTGDEILRPLDRENEKRIKKYRIVASWSNTAFIAICVLSTLGHFYARGPDHLLAIAFGLDHSEVLGSPTGYVLLFVAINNVVSILSYSIEYTARYTIFVYALLLFAKQNVAFIDDLMCKCESVTFNSATLNRIDELYLEYKELVDKLNSAYGKIPFWYLTILYCNITSIGTFLVILHGKATVYELLGGSVSGVSITFFFTMYLIHLCSASYDSMESFRQKGLKLINCQLKMIKVRDAMCECLSNTLRGVPLTKMRAGQMYDMEASIVISIFASAIPTTVMVVSLLKEL